MSNTNGNPVTPPGRRHSFRLPGFDYAQAGAYFVTICTHGGSHRFGEVVDATMVLNGPGRMVEAIWSDLPARYPSVILDEFVVMPDHLHGIILITGAGDTCPAHASLSTIIGAFKSVSTHEYVLGVRNHNWPPFEGRLWQRNYYERIIRNEAELSSVRKYISENPLKWGLERAAAPQPESALSGRGQPF